MSIFKLFYTDLKQKIHFDRRTDNFEIKSHRIIINAVGFSLVEMLVLIGLLSIIALISASLINNLNRELKAVEQRADSLNLRGTLEVTLASLPICSCLMSSFAAPFDPTATSTAVSEIKSSCAAGASTIIKAGQLVDGTQLTVNQIALENIEQLGPDLYKGQIKVNYLKTDMNIRQIKPITMGVQFKTGSGSNPKIIVACFGVGVSSGFNEFTGSCPSGQFLQGFNNGVMLCAPVASGGPATPVYTLTNPGPGCSGNACVTYDYGPCIGNSCHTNGQTCSGNACSATNGP